jgi:hypothetical protein
LGCGSSGARGSYDAADRDQSHSLKGVEAILDAHYLGRDVQLAEAAALKLEKRNKTANRGVDHG